MGGRGEHARRNRAAGDDLVLRIELEFLGRYFEDRERGHDAPLVAYLALFPDHEAVVSKLWGQLEAVAAAAPAIEVAAAGTGAEERFGRFRVIRELGRGSQGVVHLARDDALGRWVALKILRGWGPDARRALVRFRREAAVTSRLEHPGICAVWEAGDEPAPYIAMQCVPGRTLASLIRTSGADRAPGVGVPVELPSATEADPVSRLLRVIEGVARALHAAHEAGVVHRDVKPGNVMITPTGEPVVLDFGLARDLGPKTFGLTGPGDFLGTPAYMSPEQLGWIDAEVDRRTDVHALGVTLFECLTGARPFAGTPRERRTMSDQRAGDLRRLLPGAGRDLVAVVAMALARDPDRRYTTALDFARDLERLRQHRPIKARAPGPVERLTRWVGRNPLTASTTIAAFVILVATTVVVSWQRIALEGARVDLVRESEARHRALEAYEQVGDVSRLRDAIELADSLFPVRTARVADLEAWLRAYGPLGRERLALHAAALAELDREGGARGVEARWMHAVLTQLVADLRAFADPEGGALDDVRRRLDRARAIRARTVVSCAEAWDRAVAYARAHRSYGGLELTPQEGLVPLGPDPSSGLLEFLHWESHGDPEPPRRDAAGRLHITDETGIVIVLVPGGSFLCGSQRADPSRPHYDPGDESGGGEGPVREIGLSTYLIGKYEVTQSQWRALTGENPSRHAAGTRWGGAEITGRHPVEQVSWTVAEAALRRGGLCLPTEAQWEHAARAGTTSIWYPGDDAVALEDHGNLADATYGARLPGALSGRWDDDLDDDHAIHAPVGSYRPNPFGLHDVIGNVFEWCLDYWGPYSLVTRPGDGLNVPIAIENGRVNRGGSYATLPAGARSASRNGSAESTVTSFIGVRCAAALVP